MSKIWALNNLEPAEKLVLLAIADFADDNGSAWPSIPTLARKSSLSEDTVRRRLNKLSEKGILSMTRRKDQTGRDTSYNFQLFPELSANVSLFSNASPNFSTLEGSTMQPSPSHHARVEGGMVLPSFMKHHIEPSKTYSEFFEILWKDYPLRDSHKKALIHFNATVKSEEACQRIRKALDNYLGMLKREAWRKPKSGSTWFNNWQDWEDCQTPPAASVNRPTAGNTIDDLRAKGIDV